MMKHLIVFYVGFLFLFVGFVETAMAQKADSKAVISAFKTHCVGALKANKDTAVFLNSQKLVELSPDDAKKFSPDGGRVFTIPSLKGMAVLTTNPNFKSVCSIAIHKINAQALRDQIFDYFKKSNGFRLLKEKHNEKESVTRTEFSGDIGGPVKVLISSSDSPRPNGIQVLMTIGRVQ